MIDTSGRAADLRELTLRGIILGGLITLLFTAANVYLGLKVGLTFATSIPAAVISMAILRFLSGATILENNIVQTIASAAGTLAAIIFVLPGLVIVGWWQGFPYWTTAAVCFIGGTLGVMFSVPLRRALVAGSDLPYPEGVAAAEVLKVGSRAGDGAEENQRGLRTILLGSLVSAGFALLGAMKLAATEIGRNFKIGAGASGASASLSLALIGVGHLVGLSVGLAMLLGMLIAWGGLMPVLTAAQGVAGSVDDVVGAVFSQQVRFIGAGTIGVAALWTLFKIVGPVVRGIQGSIASSRARGAGETVALGERDLSFGIVVGTILGSLVPIAGLLWFFAQGGPIAAHPVGVIAATLVFVLFVGAIIAAVTGYMAGLIGASNSPVSGVGILAVIAASLMLLFFFGRNHSEADTAALVAYALFTTAIVFSVATISNDNLQDLKTGQLVGATPWKQQFALVIGVGFGSLIIPPVLDLLNQAFGFAGAEGAGANALPAPQAALISALAKGVLGGDLRWDLIGYGALIGVVVIAVDELLGRLGKMRLPPLGVGMGIYLPMSLTILIPIGAAIGHLWEKRAARSAKPEFYSRMGVLLATGFIVGESLFGVLFAGVVAGSGSDAPLAVVGEGFATNAILIGVLLFVGVIAFTYRRTRAAADATP
ncbi:MULTISPECIES: OPT family oligopeptide transporter [Sphingopyxis]|uniref:OPT family oligopeptide transporter n=1 Tax=Sphingopyxis TaxID=165697 RepID=UPI00086AAA25|nr:MULTISPECIES: oligopeptide transporter, OPT family [Sphingopyxis]APW74250.1 oligopeptide transporter, OPT family [Sphingopyxis granuli]AVA13809.1 oligopeptide transporter, OPT family [Sphingopyxis sp. MG]ODU29293.1 MAG: oligopeptide transporter, OPT family [Sphingopyxis sp. SCN 67-31]